MNPRIFLASAIGGALLMGPVPLFAQNEITQSSYCPRLQIALERGARDDGVTSPGQVAQLQKFLAGYYGVDSNDLVTGYFGKTTLSYVQRFQREQQLPSSGYVGVLTRAKIALLCGAGNSASAYDPFLNPSDDSVCTPENPDVKVLRCPGGQTGAITRSRGSICKAGAVRPVWVEWITVSNTCSGGVAGVSCEHASPPPGCAWKTGATCAQDTLSCGASCAFDGASVESGASVTAYQANFAPFGGDCVSERRMCVAGALSGSYAHARCSVLQQNELPQIELIDARNVFAPEAIHFADTIRLYFSGRTGADQSANSIYLADCGSNGSTCGAVREVLTGVDASLAQVGDPSIVHVPARGTTPAYLIMYLTAQKRGADGQSLETGIYFSVSRDTDGVHWSAPRALLPGYRAPSALMMPDGTIALYAYGAAGTAHPFLTKFALGESGITPVPVGEVTALDAAGANVVEANAFVRYDAGAQRYEILAETVTAKRESQIDYLTSTDGLLWRIEKSGVIKAQAGERRVATPAAYPDDISRVYFASGQQASLVGMKIRGTTWVR